MVGRERSPRHMSYAVQGRFLRALAAAAGAVAVAPSPSWSPPASGAGAEGSAPRRWRSRREVVDWLSSLVSGPKHTLGEQYHAFIIQQRHLLRFKHAAWRATKWRGRGKLVRRVLGLLCGGGDIDLNRALKLQREVHGEDLKLKLEIFHMDLKLEVAEQIWMAPSVRPELCDLIGYSKVFLPKRPKMCILKGSSMRIS